MYLGAALPAPPRNKEQVSESPRSQAPNCPLGWAGGVRTGTDPTGMGGDWPSPRGPEGRRPGQGGAAAEQCLPPSPAGTCTAHLRACSQAHTALFLSQTLQAGSQTDQCVHRGGQSCRMSTHLPTHSFEILGYTIADVPRSHPHVCLQFRETQDCRHSPTCSQVATRPHLTAYGLGGGSHRFIGKHLGAFAESSHQFTCCQGKTGSCVLAHLFRRPAHELTDAQRYP